jgi:hypothetical protein
MCEYIKDDGEQCSMDDEPFCHHHEDTRFAKLWRRMDAVSGSSDGSEFGTMDRDCSECGTSLRRVERLTRHPNFGGRVLFEAVVECDCSEHVLGSQSVAEIDVPDGWING